VNTPLPPEPEKTSADSPSQQDAAWPDTELFKPSKLPVESAKPVDLNRAPTIGKIGRYALKCRLGEGGLGTVYAAHDPLLSRLLAVKTLHLEIEDSERDAFNALFLNEARAAAGLSHPNIVTVFDAGISDDRAYIAMELLKGSDLRQLRKEGWRASPAQAALIVRRVADALGYAHDKGVVHRDIKPANIFMVSRTQPRVLDFGIARITHQQDAHHTGSDIAAGSPYYMAPEQARHETVDKRADVFSLGVVLYELLTNVKPFRGATLDEITTAVLEHEPPLAHVVDPAVPEALARIAAKALAKSPDQRYRSARAFGRELRHWLDENHVVSDNETMTASQTPKKWWLITAVSGSVLIAVVTWLSWGGITSNPSEPAATVMKPTAQPLPPVVDAPNYKERPAESTVPLSASSPAVLEVVPPVVDSVTPASAVTAAASAAVGVVSANAASGSDPWMASVLATEAVKPALPVPSTLPQRSVPMPYSSVPPDRAAPNATQATSTNMAAPRSPSETLAPPVTPPAIKKQQPGSPAPPIVRQPVVVAPAVMPPVVTKAPSPLAPPVAALTGTVKVAISPWGQVEVDGKPMGTSPPVTELKLSLGKHKIVFSNTDLPSHSVVVNVLADQPITVRHKF
jgi:eukaryotic-like serine/threonine-protein kinase